MPKTWTFDPYLWLSLDIHLKIRSGHPVLAQRELSNQEQSLEVSFPTAWMRARLLRLSVIKRFSGSIDQGEVRVLQRFLRARNISGRLAELAKIVG